MEGILKGLIPAIVMPLRKDYRLDERALERYVRQKITSCDIAAVAVNTDAGEGLALLPEERNRVVQVVKGIVGKRVPVVCGISGATTLQAVEYARAFQDMGADYFLVMPQTAFRGARGKDPVIIKYHEALAMVGVPLIIFQLQESLGGVSLPHETLRELVAMDGVVAIKEASFDAVKYKETVGFLHSLKKHVTILTGNDNFILESFVLGGEGALIGFGSVFTDIQVEAIRLVQGKKYEQAFALFSTIKKLCDYCFQAPVRDYRARMKEVLVQQGVFPTNLVRPPLLPVSAREQRALKSILCEIPRRGRRAGNKRTDILP